MPTRHTGMLYSGVDEWTADPWNNLDNAGSVEDTLAYSGAQAGVAGVVPSMRLKYLRDGVNDLEYIQTLKNLGQGPWVMGLMNSVVTDWTTWSQDPVLLESARQQMGAKLDRLANPPISPCDVNGAGTTNVVDAQQEVDMALGSTTGTCKVLDVQRVTNALGGQCVST